MRITGPFDHKNLAVFFLHDESRGGAVPLTLQEALMKGDFRIEETGNIHELNIENRGDTDVFIQAGDIVKGGRQDRVLGVSMLVPARSGVIPIASFCVESGRWGRRGFEDQMHFSSSDHSYSSPRAKMALRRSAESYSSTARRYASMAYSRLQSDVWDEVGKTQSRLMQAAGPSARAAASPTSLDLSMRQAEVHAARAEYLARLENAAETDPSITGALFAVNGEVRNADAYPWTGLFWKMWGKNLNAGVTEALGAHDAEPAGLLSPQAAEAFLRQAEAGKESEHELPAGARLRQRLSDRLAFLESLKSDGDWVHRSYVAS